MGSSFKIGRLFGIPIRIDITFLLILPILAWQFGRSLAAAAQLAGVPPGRLHAGPWIWGLGIAVALFLSVLIHELAHSIYAQAKGGRIRDITLMMIGGVSQVAEPPKGARHEGVMAALGPLTSLALAGIFFLAYRALKGTGSFDLEFALFNLSYLNGFLGAFNLLPAFPMDGGRVLRALITPRLGLVRATHVAAGVGKAFALFFGVVGLLSLNLILLLIAWFVFIGAEGESRQVLVKAMLGELRVRDLMSEPVQPIDADASAEDAAERMLRERRLSLPVHRALEIVGIVTAGAIQRVPLERRRQVAVGQVAIEFPGLAPGDDVAVALREMRGDDMQQLPVVENGRLVGSLRRGDVVRGLRLKELEASLQGPYAHRHVPV